MALDGHEKKVADAKAKSGETIGRQQGHAWVVRTVYRMEHGVKVELPEKGKESEQMIEVDIFQTEPARVNCQKGLTMNLGNYESARVDTGINMPCYVEETKEMKAHITAMVEADLQAEVLEVRGQDIRPGYEAKRKEGAAKP